jgi:hypothetical protein
VARLLHIAGLAAPFAVRLVYRKWARDLEEEAAQRAMAVEFRELVTELGTTLTPHPGSVRALTLGLANRVLTLCCTCQGQPSSSLARC